MRAGATERRTEIITVEQSVMIEHPPEAVFAFVADLDNWVRPASDGGTRTYHNPAKVGDTFRQDFETQGQALELLGKVTGCEPGSSLSFDYTWEGSSLQLSFIFEPNGSGTILTGRGTGYTNGFYQMFEPFIEAEVNRSVDTNLTELKSLMEARAPDST